MNPKIAKKARPFDPNRKPKEKCFKCGQKGHWKKDCLKLKGQSGNFSIAIIESCFVANSANSWWIDSEATDHICNSLQGLRVIRSLNEGEMQLKMASSASISVIDVGDLSLSFSNNSVLVLHDCLFVLDSRNNLISVSKFCNDSYSISFNKTYVSIMKENEVVTCGTLVNILYHIHYVVIQVDNVEKSLKRKEPSINQTQLWHLRLGHINLKRIQRLVSCGPLATLTLEQLPLCQNCIQGKMTKRSFTAKGVRAQGCLDLIHSDVCGSFRVHARGSYEYFITFTDDYSRYGYV